MKQSEVKMKSTLISEEVREKFKYCFECGICTANCPMVELLTASEYNPRALLQQVIVEPEKTVGESRLWLCAWCYRCYRKCPQGLKLPEIFQKIKEAATKEGRSAGYERAIRTITGNVPLSAICWHTCFHPERALGKEKANEDARNSITFAAEVRNVPTITKEKVAIIGSGPAGLTAAFELAKNGFATTVFEQQSLPGGMLRKCMPRYRLPTPILDDEIQRITNLGVKIKTNVRIGKDLQFKDLLREYGSVFIAVGAHRGRQLGIAGEDADEVLNALEFLWKANVGELISAGKRVAVIGGGNVAVDAARTALQMKAEEVILLYRRSREEMPANPWEVKEAEGEGLKIEFQSAPKKVLTRNGVVVGLKCVRMSLGDLDETGRRKPVPIDDSEFTVNVDTVIVGIGESPETAFLPQQIDRERDQRILVNPITLETSLKGVYAGGDAVTGPATVIEAVLAGKKAACSIMKHLTVKKEVDPDE
jgi:heterodisulfide reductase subunit A